MNKTVYIVHGWWDDSSSGWIPWLKSELESRGFRVIAPDMPNTEAPDIDAWVGHLSKTAEALNEQTYFVGHSIGCQTILRYLAKLPPGQEIGGCVFVAPWFNLMEANLEDEEHGIAQPWLDTPIDTDAAREHCTKFIAIFSHNDDYVPLTDKELFKERLGARTLVEHGKGHMSGEDGVTELASALDAVVEISK